MVIVGVEVCGVVVVDGAGVGNCGELGVRVVIR